MKARPKMPRCAKFHFAVIATLFLYKLQAFESIFLLPKHRLPKFLGAFLAFGQVQTVLNEQKLFEKIQKTGSHPPEYKLNTSLPSTNPNRASLQ